MLEALFSDPGAQIKKYAKICFVVELAANLLVSSGVTAIVRYGRGMRA